MNIDPGLTKDYTVLFLILVFTWSPRQAAVSAERASQEPPSGQVWVAWNSRLFEVGGIEMRVSAYNIEDVVEELFR